MTTSAAFVATGGAVLVACSAFGIIASLIFDMGNARDLMMLLALTLAFPILLVGIWSLRGATIGFWLYFIYQWLVRSAVGQPPVLSNPFDWWFGDALALGIALVSIGTFLAGSASPTRRPRRFADLYGNNIS